jgi:hypothetical protein
MWMRAMGGMVVMSAMGATCGWASEPPHGCFRSIAEAAQQTHSLDPANLGPNGPASGGFRLEELRRDRMLNKRWAIVRSCDHPERPAMTVAMGLDDASQPVATQASEPLQAPSYTAPVVRAGATVRLVGGNGNLHLEMTGVAQSNGALGQQIQVRLVSLTTNNEAAARILTGTVRSAGVLEWEP